MMRFANELSFLFLLVPFVLSLSLYRESERRKRLQRFIDPALHEHLSLAPRELRRRGIPRGLRVTVITLLLVITLLQPQWGFQWKERKSVGLDLVVAIDLSESMLAEDVRPNRLERARREILDLLGTLEGDRIALVTFAGVAFVELPLSLDYAAFRLFLENLDADSIPVKGSNLEHALLKSLEALENGSRIGTSRGSIDHRSQGILLLTDGEDLSGDFRRIRSLAEERGVAISIVGIGTVEGAPIPSLDGYKRDKNGQIVITKLRETELTELAQRTGGVYVRSLPSDLDIQAIYRGMKEFLEATELKAGKTKRWNEYFQAPLAAALFLILVEPLLWLVRRVRSDAKGIRWEKRGASATLSVVAAFVLLPVSAGAESTEAIGKRARNAFDRGAFEESLATFEEGIARSGDDFRMYIGKGAAEYRLGHFEDAIGSFVSAAGKTSNPREKAKALYNAGNALVQVGELEEAVRRYEESLKLAPDDEDAKQNLAYTRRLKALRHKQETNRTDERRNEGTHSNAEREGRNEDTQEQSHGVDDTSKNRSGEQGEQENDETSEQEEGDKEQGGRREHEEYENQSAHQGGEGSPSRGAPEEREIGSDGEENSELHADPSLPEGSGNDAEGDLKPRSSESPQGQGGGEREEEIERSAPTHIGRDRGKEQGDITHEGQKERGAQLDADLETLLENIDEGKHAFGQYRLKKALEELKARGQKEPEKDW